MACVSSPGRTRRSAFTAWRDAAGTSAVEFALIAPLFIMLLVGLIAYATLFAIENSVQQLAAESARAGIGGLSAAERDTLTHGYIQTNVGAYHFLDPAKMTVTTGAAGNAAMSYQVTITYDMSGSFIFTLGPTFGLPRPVFTRSAAVQFGGF